MSLILHLSDLHLGAAAPEQRTYDDKFGLGEEAGETSIDHLTHTLEALGRFLDDRGRRLDALVVSGDLTKGNHADGYAEFDSVLERLGACRPDDERIVVIPGNHDVDATKKPGDRDKLARFMDATRRRYSTPLVKGLDYKGNHPRLNPGVRGRPHPVVELGDAVIVAINSADYCWTEEERTRTDWEALIGDVLPGDNSPTAKDRRELATKELRRLRTQDIPRVDKTQLKALENQLDEAGVRAEEVDLDPRLRIATIHHPITPATDEEEVKPFEVITNLAIVRTFLYHRGFHLILHGHKHSAYAAWDWLVPPRDDLGVTPHRALVLGAPGRFQIGRPVCRLIEVCPGDERPVAGAPRLRVLGINGVEASEPLQLNFEAAPVRSLAQPAFVSAASDTPAVIRARSADAAYQQLADLPVDDGVNRAVISVVDDPASTAMLPTNYKGIGGVPPLEDLVEWWQQRRPEAVRSWSGSEFNHGERLYGDEDAIRRAVLALPSSKAFALLVRPEEAGLREREFPAFSEVQLQERRKARDERLLDVVGIYRKQDLDLWWPVNMAELAYIQSRALATANDEKQLGARWCAGRLIAMATLGVHDDVLPQMAGTALDRAVDLRPEWIYRLAYLAVHPGGESESEWRRALGDIGDRPGEGLLVPSVGICRLRDALRTHLEEPMSPGFRKLVRSVEQLAERAQQAETTLRTQPAPNQTMLDDWGAQLKDLAGQSQNALRSLARAASKNEKG